MQVVKYYITDIIGMTIKEEMYEGLAILDDITKLFSRTSKKVKIKA